MEEPDQVFMRMAIDQALKALEAGEVPVGAVVVLEGRILGRGHNRVVQTSDPTAHAEIVAIREAGVALSNYRLNGTTLYSTIEPCPMCAGAIVHARIARLVYGAADPRAGAVATHFHLCTSEVLNHRVNVMGGILESESRSMLQSFFRAKRSGDIEV